jgi:hypothetical protein
MVVGVLLAADVCKGRQQTCYKRVRTVVLLGECAVDTSTSISR